MTFDGSGSMHHNEQEVGSLIPPENGEIINFETNDNPEFKVYERNAKSKSKSKKRKSKKAISRSRKGIKTMKTFTSKRQEIEKAILPLGEGIETNLLDFNNVNEIPLEMRKELKFTKEDDEYFSGAKKKLHSKRANKPHDRFDDQERPKFDECPLSKRVEEYFGLQQKRKIRKEKKMLLLQQMKQQDQVKINHMLEQGIIDDIGINFLFRRGSGLKDGLIDIDRAYKIIQKIDNTFKESQLRVNHKREQGIKVDPKVEEEKLYNFDFVKFFEKSELDVKSESSQRSFFTSSSVPRKPDCYMQEEKWTLIMKFLRANPNLILKLVPTTMAVDEQGVEEIQKRAFKANKDLDTTQKSIRVKSAVKKKKKIQNKRESMPVTIKDSNINKSDILASSNYPITQKKTNQMDDTFYSDSRSHINKSNININAMPNTKLDDRGMISSNALFKADSIYSSNNVPVIKNIKARPFRPMSMKQPRKLRQQIDEKYLDQSHKSKVHNLPTAWNNPNVACQVPFRSGANILENSFMSSANMKSPEFSSKFNLEYDRAQFRDKKIINSPSAVVDFTKPILSIRNQNDSIEQEFLRKAMEIRQTEKNKRGSTIAAAVNQSIVSANIKRDRVRTREGKRPKRHNQDITQDQSKSKSRKKAHSKSPSDVRPMSKNLKIRKKKKSKASAKVRSKEYVSSLDK